MWKRIKAISQFIVLLRRKLHKIQLKAWKNETQKYNNYDDHDYSVAFAVNVAAAVAIVVTDNDENVRVIVLQR